MKHGLFFRFYRMFHNEPLCCLLARIFYLPFCLKFLLKKLIHKKHNVNMTVQEAHNIIESVYPKPECHPVYENPTINDDIDLSIVIPVYNYVEIIAQNIESVLNQNTKYNYEIILVDDGSTDGAREVVMGYQNNPKVKIICQKNAGIGAARNTGINSASGKYLMFIDCDDTVHNDIVEVLMNKAYSKNYDMVICAHNLVKEKDGKVYEVVPNVYPICNLVGYKNGDEIMNYPGLPWCKVYKRELFNNVRFFSGYWYEDTIIQFLIFTQCKNFSYLPNIEYEYKWYEKNFSHTQENSTNIKAIDRYWLLREIIDQYGKIGLKKDEVFYTLLLRHISVYYYSEISRLQPQVVEALYVLAKELYDKYKPSKKVKLPYFIRQIEKAFDNNDFELWKLSSRFT